MMTVVLEKGPKGERTFDAESAQRAYQRAAALCDLHGCSYSVDGDVIRVHASAYYGRP
jgi:hypothetical protein